MDELKLNYVVCEVMDELKLNYVVCEARLANHIVQFQLIPDTGRQRLG